MKIKYKSVVDEYSCEIDVDVNSEIEEFICKADKVPSNQERKKRYHHVLSLDSAEYEGLDFANPKSFTDEFESEVSYQYLLKTLDILTETQRRRFTLHAIYGMSFREIAAIEGVNFKSVDESIKSARTKLQAVLKEKI